MAATLIGTVGSWGIASAETTLGVIIESIDETSRNEKSYLKNNQGERVGRSDYDESIEVKLQGKLTSTSPFAGKLSAAITLANAISSGHLVSVSAGKVLVGEVRKNSQNEDWKGVEIDIDVLPNFPSS